MLTCYLLNRPGERRIAAQPLVDHHSQGILIAGRAWFSLELLRRHIGDGPSRLLGLLRTRALGNDGEWRSGLARKVSVQYLDGCLRDQVQVFSQVDGSPAHSPDQTEQVIVAKLLSDMVAHPRTSLGVSYHVRSEVSREMRSSLQRV